MKKYYLIATLLLTSNFNGAYSDSYREKLDRVIANIENTKKQIAKHREAILRSGSGIKIETPLSEQECNFILKNLTPSQLLYRDIIREIITLIIQLKLLIVDEKDLMSKVAPVNNRLNISVDVE